jgi:hypothetical protein
MATIIRRVSITSLKLGVDAARRLPVARRVRPPPLNRIRSASSFLDGVRRSSATHGAALPIPDPRARAESGIVEPPPYYSIAGDPRRELHIRAIFRIGRRAAYQSRQSGT